MCIKILFYRFRVGRIRVYVFAHPFTLIMPRTLAIQRTGRHFVIIEAFKNIRPSNLLQCASVIIFQGFKHCLHTFLNTQFLLSLDFIGFQHSI